MVMDCSRGLDIQLIRCLPREGFRLNHFAAGLGNLLWPMRADRWIHAQIRR